MTRLTTLNLPGNFHRSFIGFDRLFDEMDRVFENSPTNGSGGYPPYNYNWIGPNNFSSNTEDITNLLPGFYECFLIDSVGCEESISINLIAPNPIEMELISLEDKNCNNDAHITFNSIGGAGLVNFSVNTSWGEVYNITSSNSCQPGYKNSFHLEILRVCIFFKCFNGI